jgi:hypothetical protein
MTGISNHNTGDAFYEYPYDWKHRPGSGRGDSVLNRLVHCRGS